MKRFILFAAAFALLLTGCSGQADTSAQVMASFYPMKLLTEAIAGDAVTVSSMTPQIQGCLHNYQLLPSDLKRITGAEMCVINGLGMETFSDLIAEQAPDAVIVDASADITDTTVTANGHAWLYLPAAIQQASAIEEALAAHWPEDAGTFHANGEALRTGMEALRVRLEALSGTEVQAVCFHEGLALLAQEAGIEVIAVLSLDEETPTTHQLHKLLAQIQASPRCLILTDKGAEAYAVQTTVIAETQAVECPLYTMTRADGDMDYLSMMEYNIQALEEALS